MVESYARQLFLPFFFNKKIKRQARAKNDASFIFFILLVAQLLPRTDAISLSPLFRQTALYARALSKQ